MAKIQVDKFRVSLYGGMVYYTDDRKKFNKICRKVGAFECENSDAGVTLKVDDPDGGVGYLIGIFDGDDSTLVHEVSHVAFMILDRAGIDPRDSNNEAFCYLIGWLFSEVKKLQPQNTQAV